MTARPRISRILAVLVLLGIAAAAGYGFLKPGSSPGRALFHACYGLSGDKAAALQDYDRQLLKHHKGSIPIEIDDYLLKRIRTTGESAERIGIIDFYRLRGSERLTGHLAAADDAIKREFFNSVMPRLDAFPPHEVQPALLFVEALRRGKALPREGFTKGGSNLLSPEDQETLKARFLSWWGRGLPWPGNKEQNPLEGTGIVISGR